MQVKRYHADDMKQAMDAAIRELGSDAVMLSYSKVRKKGFKNLFRKPILEVQFAYDPAKIPSAKKINTNIIPDGDFAASGSIFSPDDKGWGHKGKANAISNEQMEQFNSRINSLETIASKLTDFIDKFSYVKRDITYNYPDEVQSILEKLIDAQVREELAHSLAKQAEQMLRQHPGVNAVEIVEHLMLEQLGRSEPILHKNFSQRRILVLGPTGVGKTTSIVKLAADFSVKQKKSVGIINADTFRIGAQEQLQTYADILGIPLQVVYNTQELADALENMSDLDIIFVDTTGKRPGDEQHKEDLLEIVQILKPDDTLLCLSATTSFSSIKEMVDTYGFVDDYRVIITKLDETKYRGSVLNISWYTHKPFAYVTTGQDVPDDIEVADTESLVRQIIRD